MVTGVFHPPPPLDAFIFIAHKVGYSHFSALCILCSSNFIEVYYQQLTPPRSPLVNSSRKEKYIDMDEHDHALGKSLNQNTINNFISRHEIGLLHRGRLPGSKYNIPDTIQPKVPQIV